jgi:hypothetical protein
MFEEIEMCCLLGSEKPKGLGQGVPSPDAGPEG